MRIVSAPRFFAGPPLTTTVEAAFRAALDRLGAVLEARLEHVALERIFPGGYEAADWFRIVGVEQAHALGRDVIDREAERLDPVFLGYMRAAFEVTLEDHLAARGRRYRYTQELDELLGTDAVLVTPTLTVDGWSADGHLAGQTAAGLPGWVFNTEPPNLTGHPAISLPAGHLPNGLPFGLQIVGPRFGDWMLLDLAEAWETVAEWPLVANGCHPFGAADLAA
jgi:Asp-tRNA(Asn)/Glu-tRNA(Gln) amidotransferase A subunit family amidase